MREINQWKILNPNSYPYAIFYRSPNICFSCPSSCTQFLTWGREKRKSIEKLLKDNAGIAHSHHSFRRGKLCLSNLISFYDIVTQLANQRKPVDVIFLYFSKAFDTISHSILLDKASRRLLDKHIVWWVQQLTHVPGTKGGSEWHDIRLATRH